ncbi:MAG: BlaI/MecI/CopY family transcriptional regulator [Verrucomicrobia bacterium]|nr:BlaI/MecI/CopY family transcriptional regulator [Verrucomicrobiota bacterium]MCH8513540.1 BlaI/MecI/CopY family transcriptional regulator [Kiritimatiellia bacterium]
MTKSKTKKTTSPKPTDGELDILRVLWERGPSSVREVHEDLVARKQTIFNTTLKLLQIMNEKGLVNRDDSGRPHIYRAAIPEEQMQKQLVNDLLDRAFGGAARKMVAALTDTGLSAGELEEIHRVLDAHRNRKGTR